MPPTLVQEVAFTEGGGMNTDLVLPSAPTPGNVLVVWHACRDTRRPLAPTGFTSFPDGYVAAQFSSGHDQDVRPVVLSVRRDGRHGHHRGRR